MVYKLGRISDLVILPSIDPIAYDMIFEYVKVLSYEYGENRNIDHSDGGYVLFATESSDLEELKTYFDYSKSIPEYVNRSGGYCSSLYVLNNDYCVVLILKIKDAPACISDHFEEGY